MQSLPRSGSSSAAGGPAAAGAATRPAAASAAATAALPRAAAAAAAAATAQLVASRSLSGRARQAARASAAAAAAAAAPALADRDLEQQQKQQAAADADALPAPAPEPLSAPRARLEFRPRVTVRQLLATGSAGDRAEVRGWVRTVRNQKAFAFVNVNDGSSVAGLQVVASPEATAGYEALLDGGARALTTGCSVRVVGALQASPGAKQALELRAEAVELVGACDAEAYPLQKKRHTLEFLRGMAHLRPRTNVIGAAARVRSCLAFATHEFFAQSGFQYVHTPIISASDCEGAGEMFQVTTLLQQQQQQQQQGAGANGGGGGAGGGGAAAAPAAPALSPEEVRSLERAVAEQGDRVRAAKAASSTDKARVEAEVQQLLALKQRLAQAAAAAAGPASPPSTPHHAAAAPAGPLDYSRDFFGEPAFLTVSGQLNAEMYACALGDVYTFGPTFRAENSNTARHLAEFWMVEPEMAFCDLSGDMACAEAYLRHCARRVLERCGDDVAFFDAQVERGLAARLDALAGNPFETMTYTEAVRELERHAASRPGAFEFPVAWGADLQSEHERWLAEAVAGGRPLVVTDYPKDIKAFYMRLNDDGRTVAAMDVLVPRVGELIGGSQREERLPVLEARMRQVGLDPRDYAPYVDLRRYGSAPHSGFGLGFERLVQLATGIENIRDVIPFPRYPGHVAF
jgi:asparaginyl-tRNA synthetase